MCGTLFLHTAQLGYPVKEYCITITNGKSLLFATASLVQLLTKNILRRDVPPLEKPCFFTLATSCLYRELYGSKRTESVKQFLYIGRVFGEKSCSVFHKKIFVPEPPQDRDTRYVGGLCGCYVHFRIPNINGFRFFGVHLAHRCYKHIGLWLSLNVGTLAQGYFDKRGKKLCA